MIWLTLINFWTYRKPWKVYRKHQKTVQKRISKPRKLYISARKNQANDSPCSIIVQFIKIWLGFFFVRYGPKVENPWDSLASYRNSKLFAHVDWWKIKHDRFEKLLPRANGEVVFLCKILVFVPDLESWNSAARRFFVIVLKPLNLWRTVFLNRVYHLIVKSWLGELFVD